MARRPWQRLRPLALAPLFAAAALLPGAGTAGAQPRTLAETIAADALEDDVYVEAAPVVPPSALGDLAGRIATTDQRWALVVVDHDPGNAKQLASDVLGELRSVGGDQSTVVVLSPTSIGAESRIAEYRPRLDQALRDALPALDRSPVLGIADVFRSLSGAELPAAAPAANPGDDGGRDLAPIVVGGGALLLAAGTAALAIRRR
jgi:hypothetical protein